MHFALKWIPPKENGINGYFKEVKSESKKYYSLASYLEYDDDQDELYVDTLGELYLLWRQSVQGDIDSGEKGKWKYHFYLHNEIEENGEIVDYITPVKIYRRGKKIFLKNI